MPPKSKEAVAPAIQFKSHELFLAMDTFRKLGLTVDVGQVLRMLDAHKDNLNHLVWIPLQFSGIGYELRQFNPDVHPLGLELLTVFPNAVELMRFTIKESFDTPYNYLKHPDLVFALDGTNVINTDNAVVIKCSDGEHIKIPKQHIKPISVSNMRTWVMYENSSRNKVFINNFINSYYTDTLFVYNNPSITSSTTSSNIKTSAIRYNPDYRLDDEGNYLETAQSTTKYFIRDYLKDQIRTRYGFFARPQSGVMNPVIDSYFPKLVYDHSFDMHSLRYSAELPATSCAISPLIAELLNVRRIPVEQLCRVLGFDVSNIRTLLTAVKARQLNFVFAGVGGTGMNTLFWLTELCDLTNMVNLFNTVTIYESESIEYSNMLRFPLSLSHYTDATTRSHKGTVALGLADRLSRNGTRLNDKYLSSTNVQSSDMIAPIFTYEYSPDGKRTTVKSREDTIIYGAPTIASRDDISSIGNFIAATHANTGCSLWLNPKQDQDIQVESYGMIQLGGFFMNQLRMAIALLEYLASNQSLSDADKQLFRFEFDGNIQLRTDRQYHWQLVRDLNMMTEDEANQQ